MKCNRAFLPRQRNGGILLRVPYFWLWQVYLGLCGGVAVVNIFKINDRLPFSNPFWKHNDTTKPARRVLKYESRKFRARFGVTDSPYAKGVAVADAVAAAAAAPV